MGGDCVGFLTNLTSSCFCDEACYMINDCCDDITEINCSQDNGEYMYVCIAKEHGTLMALSKARMAV